jgi:hypothetical protein
MVNRVFFQSIGTTFGSNRSHEHTDATGQSGRARRRRRQEPKVLLQRFRALVYCKNNFGNCGLSSVGLRDEP